MFRGLNNINMDAKGRLAIPTKYREMLIEHCAARLVVTVNDRDRCLSVYPLPEWEELQKKIENLPNQHPSVRRLQRLLLGYATDLELDGSGRILLSQPLREYAGLEKEVVLIGQVNKLELWDKALWDEQCEAYINDDTPLSELPVELLELSL